MGYELLYRNSPGNVANITNGDAATRKVLTDAVSLFGLQQLTGGRFAYINFTSRLILDDFVRKADPEKVVVQVMGNALINEDVENKLRALRQSGYMLVLKNYIGQTRLRHQLSLFDVIRVNFKRTTPVFQRAAVRNYGTPETVFMADRIENEPDFQNALSMGYLLFQGYYFRKPDLLSIPILPLAETAYGKILHTLLHISPDVRWEVECARIIENDLLLSYLFPREMAALPPPSGRTRTRTKSPDDIRAAIYRMGPHYLRRWVCLAFLRHNNASGDEDLPRQAFRRGLFMDALAAQSRLEVDVQSGNVFLLGILSLMETIVGESPAYLLRGLDISTSVWDALTGRVPNDYALLLRYVEFYETHNPRFAPPPDIRTRLSDGDIAGLYRACGEESDAAMSRMDKPVS
ncbi:MAG: hypothetical protein IJR54_07590 [Oscillibacter sp.]|nr:hypothetical protein [Oscillibacter sp.]